MRRVVAVSSPETMRSFFFLSLFGLLATMTSTTARGEERNLWPLYVRQTTVSADSSSSESAWTGVGPFLFSQPTPLPRFPEDPVRFRGFRPFYVEALDPQGQLLEGDILYPLFTYRRDPDGYRWSVLSLFNHYSMQSVSTANKDRGFDLWPFYFSRQTGSSDTSYHAVFPLYGSVINRFGQDRWTWVLFPLYGKFEKRAVTTTTVPWPFIKILQGEGNHGFAFWPLFGYRAKAETYREQFYLWPLIYKNEAQLWESQPDVKWGFLPFYAATKNAYSHSETYLWPFFGYTDRTAPDRYHERDYFWPLLVQGRGDTLLVNRWAPFYTHSLRKGTDKTWILWPFWRQESYVDGPLQHTHRQLLYFLYRDTEQRSVNNPVLPPAHKTHYWPLLSVWDNGAGKKQIQALSPFEVFFSTNDIVRAAYTPFFAVYRYSRTAPDQIQQSLLWNFITYRRNNYDREFHVGPLFSSQKRSNARRYTVGNGLLALERSIDQGWRFSFCDFKHRDAKSPTGVSAP